MNNLLIAIGMASGALSLIWFFYERGARDYRGSVVAAIATAVLVLAVTLSDPSGSSDSALLMERMKQLSEKNEAVLRYIQDFSGGIPTKAQLAELVARIDSYRNEIQELKTRIAQLPAEEANKLRLELSQRERTLKELEVARQQYLGGHPKPAMCGQFKTGHRKLA